MSARYVQGLRIDSYIHNPAQRDCFLGGNGQETPGDAQKVVTQGKKIVKLFYENQAWNIAINDGTAPVPIDTDYEPDFRVRGIKLYTTDDFYRLIYDLPESQLVDDYWAVGIVHPMWITKVYLTDANITQGQISLIG